MCETEDAGARQRVIGHDHAEVLMQALLWEARVPLRVEEGLQQNRPDAILTRNYVGAWGAETCLEAQDDRNLNVVRSCCLERGQNNAGGQRRRQDACTHVLVHVHYELTPGGDSRTVSRRDDRRELRESRRCERGDDDECLHP